MKQLLDYDLICYILELKGVCVCHSSQELGYLKQIHSRFTMHQQLLSFGFNGCPETLISEVEIASTLSQVAQLSHLINTELSHCLILQYLNDLYYVLVIFLRLLLIPQLLAALAIELPYQRLHYVVYIV